MSECILWSGLVIHKYVMWWAPAMKSILYYVMLLWLLDVMVCFCFITHVHVHVSSALADLDGVWQRLHAHLWQPGTAVYTPVCSTLSMPGRWRTTQRQLHARQSVSVIVFVVACDRQCGSHVSWFLLWLGLSFRVCLWWQPVSALPVPPAPVSG